MLVNVQLFASLRELVGDETTVEVEAPVTVGRLLAAFIDLHPSLRGAEQSLNVAVEQSYAFPDQVIEPGQEVAIFPPVSGG